MPATQFAFQYTTGRQANIAILIFSQDQQSIYVTGSSMTATTAVADGAFATGRLTATEGQTLTGTKTGRYLSSPFPPGLPAAYYLLAVYDVASPSNSSPGPTDLAQNLNASGILYWDTANLSDGVTTVLMGAGALLQIGGTSGPGAGADQCTLTITNSMTGFPIADADVWVTTDAAGANVIFGTAQTNGAGQVLALLDAGVGYYLFVQKDGERPIVAQHFVAVAD